MDDICKRVKQIRTDLSLNQVEFSKAIGVTNSHISKIERGGSVPSNNLIKLICKVYGVNEEWLLSGKGNMYAYETDDEIERKLAYSSGTVTKMLQSDSRKINELAADLKFRFSDIINIEDLEQEEQQIAYLKIVDRMFRKISYFNEYVKYHYSSRQLVTSESVIYNMNDYKESMNQCIDDYQNLLL